ncbi:disrupted in renal carcinoma protein 2 [Lingula anatina]|uniref:Disrupted in renal carcinoma protein 2 n=1 Tax=Lingula anatina TaxID=7574 RepID=A0A1S3JXL1_LINAN|nr:disrupted in renal carcinoma protein 2 [Lingula anatina]|eukprot:XP_013415113.1 disrupted in renal carcinoma protein 2 [Lingula anatina]
MFIEAGVCVAVFVSMLLYFPAKPPTPPSVSASKKRVDYRRGVFTLLRKYQVFAIGVPYALTGVYGSWMSLLGVILQDKVSQDEAAYLGFWSSIAGILVAVLFARISDLFAGHLKAAVLILLFVSAGSYTWFAALIETFVLPPVPGWIAMTYISIILGGICEIALQPFGLELACEASYPVAEGVTAGLLTALYNGVAVIFFFSFMIPQVDIQYMNWVLVAAVVVSIPLTISYRESYRRLSLDSR